MRSSESDFCLFMLLRSESLRLGTIHSCCMPSLGLRKFYTALGTGVDKMGIQIKRLLITNQEELNDHSGIEVLERLRKLGRIFGLV